MPCFDGAEGGRPCAAGLCPPFVMSPGGFDVREDGFPCGSGVTLISDQR